MIQKSAAIATARPPASPRNWLLLSLQIFVEKMLKKHHYFPLIEAETMTT